MNNFWFKFYGTPYDHRLLSVAKCARVKVTDVLAVWYCVMFHQSADGGTVEDFDDLACDLFCRLKEGTTRRIIDCMYQRGLCPEAPSNSDVSGDEISLENGQVRKRSKAAERQAKYRQNKALKMRAQQEGSEDSDAGVTGSSITRDVTRDVTQNITRGITRDITRDVTVTPIERIERIDREDRSIPPISPKGDSVTRDVTHNVCDGVTHNVTRNGCDSVTHDSPSLVESDTASEPDTAHTPLTEQHAQDSTPDTRETAPDGLSDALARETRENYQAANANALEGHSRAISGIVSETPSAAPASLSESEATAEQQPQAAQATAGSDTGAGGPELTPEKPARTRRRYDYRDNDFRIWWEAYPLHEGEKPAKEAWDRLIKSGRLPDLDTLMKALAWQKASRKWQDGYAFKPTRYLKEEHFNDEPPQPQRFSYAPDARGRTPYIRPEDEGNFKPLAPLLPKLPDGRPDYMDYMRNPEKYKDLL